MEIEIFAKAPPDRLHAKPTPFGVKKASKEGS
jgi:hypothetical protein